MRRFFRALAVDVSDDYSCAFARVGGGALPADAASSAGDEDDFVFKQRHGGGFP